MSIPATMKFLVRGKSVDFKNREGSSPSIPKSLVDSPTFYPILFFILIGGSKFLIFLIHSILLQMDLSGNGFFLSHALWWIFDTRTNDHLWVWARNPHLNDSQSIYLLILKLTKSSFWRSKKFRDLDKTL